MLPSGGGLRSCGDLREVLPGEAWMAGVAVGSLLVIFVSELPVQVQPPHH